MRKTIAISCLALGLLGASHAVAQNLVNGPNFDSVADFSFWTVNSSAALALGPDFEGSPSSGSAQITNTAATGNSGAGIFQCAGAVTLPLYDFGGRAFIPAGQTNTGFARINIFWFGGAGCGSLPLGISTTTLATAVIGSWVSLAAVNEAPPPGAVSFQLQVFPAKTELGGSFVANFDRVYVGPPGTTPVALSGFSVD